MVGHFRHLLKDMINTKIHLNKSDKLFIMCGDDIIIKYDI